MYNIKNGGQRMPHDIFHLFFFQAEDGIRDLTVTGVQTCALPISEDSWQLEISSLSFIFGELNVVGVRGCGRRNQELCMELLGEGKIKPVIDRTFPLRDRKSVV